MDTVYPDQADNFSLILEAIKNNAGYSQDWWKSFAFTRDFAPQLNLTRTDLAWLDAVMRHVSFDKNGAVKKVFPSQAIIAKMMGCCVRTVRRCQAKFEALKWIIVEKRRARNAQSEGGQWASNYYDLKPLYALQSQISALIKGKNQRKKLEKEEALAQHGRTSVSHHDDGVSPMALPSTGGHGSPTNKTQSLRFVNKNKPYVAKANSADKRPLSDDELSVLSELKSHSYDERTGQAHVRKHGAAHVKTVIEAVTKFCANVKDKARMINYYMTRPLPDSYTNARDAAWEGHLKAQNDQLNADVSMLPPVPAGVDVEAARAEFGALPQYERNAIAEAGRAEAHYQDRELKKLSIPEQDERIKRYILLKFLKRKKVMVCQTTQKLAT